MTQVTLIRHGQAQTEARDEASYDSLGPLGHQQARWLGEHLNATGERFMRVYSGTLRRQRETAAGLGAEDHAPVTIDPRFNEFEYFTMSELYAAQHGVEIPAEREGFIQHMPRLMAAWEAGEIDGVPESFQSFEARIAEGLEEVSAGDGPAAVITSGGVIGMSLRLSLGLDTRAFAHVCLAIFNSSVHRLHRIGETRMVTQFNALPHLDHPERRTAQTHF